jgi:hypothetical protein
VNITVHTDPAWGSHHATVHDELGETVARFYGQDCVGNANLFVHAFRIASVLAGLPASEVRVHVGNGQMTLRAWRAGMPYEVSATGTDAAILATLVGRMGKLMDGVKP